MFISPGHSRTYRADHTFVEKDVTHSMIASRSRLLQLLYVLCFLPFINLVCLAGDVTTYHNDPARTGQNLQETVLTPGNVNAASFGKLLTLPVDGVIDAEPLYLSGVLIPGRGIFNVVYVVTEHDSVYAFDADRGTLLWQVSVLGSDETASDTHNCNQIRPEIGITSTPVIDRSSGPNGTIYVVAMSKDSDGYYQRIHALDVTNGQEEFGGPTTIQAKYPGRGDNSQGGFVIFDPKQYAERQALLLHNHVIYTGWTSHCDYRPYTGWVIGYDESTLKQTKALNLTPNGDGGSIWQSGAGMASDGAAIYLLDANGTFDRKLNKKGFPIKGDLGNAFVKLWASSTRLAVADYFAGYNTIEESDQDIDLGSGGPLLLPRQKDQNGKIRALAVGSGKNQSIYIVDRDNMGKFNPGNDDAIYQEIDGALGGGLWSMPAYYNGALFFGPVGNQLLKFQLTQARLSTSPVSKSANSFTYPGTTPSVSANGPTNGIVWAIEHSDPNDVLHAYDSRNLATELYNSNQAPRKRDHLGSASHFGTPMIANGKVYVGTQDSVVVFGLLGQ
jgi:outer membrane protein assembly factor BamB